MKLLSVSENKYQRFENALAGFVGGDVYDEDLLRSIRETSLQSCPTELVQRLGDLRGGAGTSGALLIKGCAMEAHLPATPRHPDDRGGTLNLLPEVTTLGIALVLGEPIAYRNEKHGALVQHVFPIEEQRDAPSNESSTAMLDLHTELVYSPRCPNKRMDIDSPDFLILASLRSDPRSEAETLVAEIDGLCAGVDKEHLSTLCQPRFELRAPYSFTRCMKSDRPWVGPAPIVTRKDNGLTAAFDVACGTRGVDAEAQTAFVALQQAARAPGVVSRVKLQAGDVLVLDNRRCAHGRTPFSAAYDGTDRWLLRIYVRRSLSGLQPFDPDHSFRVF